MKKYTLIGTGKYINVDDYSKKDYFVYQIKALKDFSDVKAGDLGGYVASEDNLSQEGNCWIYDDAMVIHDACLTGDAIAKDKALIRDNALVGQDAIVSKNAIIKGNASCVGSVTITDNATIQGNANIHSHGAIYNDAFIGDKANILGTTVIKDQASVCDHATINNNARICENARIRGFASITNDAIVKDNADVSGNAEIVGNAIISSDQDYIVFKNNWSSGRYFTYTRSNAMWKVGCFYGTSSELIKKAYRDSELSGKNYEAYVNLVKNLLLPPKKKYELVEDDTITFNGRTLFRIRALIDLPLVKPGDLGGYIESENNLSQEGTCWVYRDAMVNNC